MPQKVLPRFRFRIRFWTGLFLGFSLLLACTPLSPPTRQPSTPLPPTLLPQATETLPPQASLPWWDSTVFYEVFVRSFYDSNGDGIGDINGLIEKLDYLNDGSADLGKSLGVKGLWLMPVFPSPSYHGYDVINYRGVNPDYGSVADLKRLVAEAHRRGMRIILDLPINHTSNKNPWFAVAGDPHSPYRDWYIWADPDPGYQGPWGEPVWHPLQAGGYYYGAFSAEMPDLNYRNPAVTRQMDDIARFWLADVGVDGFRLDAAPYLIEDGKNQVSTALTHQWYQGFRTFYKNINPDALTVGEVWRPSSEAASYTRKNDQLDLAFDFYLANVIKEGVRSGVATNILSNLGEEIKIFQPGTYASFLSNHDMNRVINDLDGDMLKAGNAATILLTSPGVPFIYYGEEIGMSGAKPDESIRRPMQWTGGKNAGFTSGSPWEDVNPDYTQRNAAIQNGDPNSLLNLYRQLIHARNQSEALKIGDLIKVTPSNSHLFAEMRAAGDDVILVLVNLSDQPIRDFTLGVQDPRIKGNFKPLALVGPGGFIDLHTDPAGGFRDYQPLIEIPAHANLLIKLKSIP